MLDIDLPFPSCALQHAQVSIIFPGSSWPSPLATFLFSSPLRVKLLESVACIFYFHFHLTSAQDSTCNIAWKQPTLKLSIIYKWLNNILSYLMYQQLFTLPTSETQISVSSRERSLTSTSIHPAAYLLSLLISQKHIKLDSCFLQAHPIAMSFVLANGLMI